MHELEYLRQELNQRIVFDNDNRNRLIGSILMAWGGVLLLFAAIQQISVVGLASCPAMPKSNDVVNVDWAVFGYFVMVAIFFISVVILYFFSKRFFDNNNGVTKIAAYNAIFHEKRPVAGDNKEDMIRTWELATFELTKEEMKDPVGERIYKINDECFYLTVFAIFMEILLWCVFFFKFANTEHVFDVAVVIICGILILISLFSSISMKRNMVWAPQKWHERKKYYLNLFLDYAVKNKYYRENELVGRFGQEFLNEIGYTSVAADTVGP